MAIGGAEDKLGRRTVLKTFVALAGGSNAKIAVVPTASTLGPEVVEVYDALFRKLGARDVVAARPESREEAEDPDVVGLLDDVTGIFMTGGNQLKLSGIVNGTAFGEAIRAAHDRGAVVGGTSAGASIQSSHMVAFGPGGTTPKQRMTQLAAGLGLVRDVVIDQHFAQRNRYGRLLMLVAQSPGLLGIGVDEDTGAVITEEDGVQRLGVVGRGVVTIFDGRNVVSNAHEARRTAPLLASGVVLHVLPAGAVFNLTDKVLVRQEPVVDPSVRGGARGCGTGPETVGSRHRHRGRVAERSEAPPRPPGGQREQRRRPSMTTPSPDLSILETRVYRGANVWSYDKAIHLVVDLGSLEDYPTNTLTGFTDHLLEMLPGLREHSCSRGRRGGFVERLNEGTWLGHVTEHVALALQQAVGHDIRRGKTRQVKGEKGRYNIIYGYVDENVGLAAARLAVRLVNHLVDADPNFDWDHELESFIIRAERSAFGPSTQAILDEAVSRDIPWIRLNKHSLVQLGQGVHQKRIRATMTSATSAIAVDVASDKDLTTRLLGAAGLPVPKQESVRTMEQAVVVAERIGYPVVVKPLDGNHGRGVCLDLQNAEDVREAFPVGAGAVASRLGDRGVLHHRPRLPLPDHRRPAGRGRRARARPRHR